MPLFRVTFKNLREFGKIRKRPIKSVLEELRENGYIDTLKGRIILEREKPLVLKYGQVTYIIRKDAIDILVSEDLWAQVRIPERPELFLTGKLAPFLGTMGMGEPTSLFRKKSHRYWADAETLAYKYGTSTFTQFPTFTLITLPYRKRILIYIHFRPRISPEKAIESLSRILGVSKKEVREALETLMIEGLIKEVIYETYPKKVWHLLATKIVSDNDGKLTFTKLRQMLTKYGLTYREAFNSIFKAMEEGLIEERKTPNYYRYFVTPKGRRELAKLPKPKIKRGLILTSLGREEALE